LLVDNYILIRQIEEFSLKNGRIECRACTSNDKGVAHCSTCSSYLCGKCCQAHQYMKCFEQHHVRRLSQSEENSIDKCLIHSNQLIKFFCKTCSQNFCEECFIFHPTPQHDIQKNEYEQIKEDFNNKLNEIDQIRLNALANLDHQLTSLQHDYDKTKTQIDLSHTQYQQALNQVYVSEKIKTHLMIYNIFVKISLINFNV
jgi:hypothetical protein